jgi:hypothetical protein
MFDMHSKKQGQPEPDAIILAGLAPQDIARLMEARSRYLAGALNEGTVDYKRLHFARWLYEHGRLTA